MRAGRLGSGHPILFSLVAAVAALALHSAHAADPAQKVARIAFINPYSPATAAPGSLEFWARLQELGWVQGKNLIVETRSAEGRIDRLPALMADVVAKKVDVIVTRGTPAAIAAKNATTEIPIVVASMGDPVGTGLVATLARPGGNLTGLSLQGTLEFYGKYSADPAILFRRAADYVDKILRGAKPADLPVEQATQFKLVVNLKTAKALGLTIPESILLRADEVIR